MSISLFIGGTSTERVQRNEDVHEHSDVCGDSSRKCAAKASESEAGSAILPAMKAATESDPLEAADIFATIRSRAGTVISSKPERAPSAQTARRRSSNFVWKEDGGNDALWQLRATELPRQRPEFDHGITTVHGNTSHFASLHINRAKTLRNASSRLRIRSNIIERKKGRTAPPTPAFKSRGSQSPGTTQDTNVSNWTSTAETSEENIMSRWNAVFEKGGEITSDPEVIDLVQLGVPASIRPEVWWILSGAKQEAERYSSSYFHQLLAVCDARGGSQADKEIRKDIIRTLPEAELFQTPRGRESLARVLSAYCLRNPDSVGYCQSMNQIAGALLTVLRDEEMTFWVLVCMIESRIGYYSPSMCGLEVDQRVMQALCSYTCPKLSRHLQEHSCAVGMFAVPWFLCLGVEAPIPIGSIPLFWDHLFLYGDELIFAIGLELLKLKKEYILAIDDPGDLLIYLLHGGIREEVDWKKLLDTVKVLTGARYFSVCNYLYIHIFIHILYSFVRGLV